MKIYLASASPRRSMLLKKIGINFKSIFPKVEEILEEGINPETLVRRNAILKAKNVLNEIDEGIIIAADTIVVKDSNILGKPKDAQEAYRMLMMLSGISHEVFTAVVVLENLIDFLLRLINNLLLHRRYLQVRNAKAKTCKRSVFEAGILNSVEQIDGMGRA